MLQLEKNGQLESLERKMDIVLDTLEELQKAMSALVELLTEEV